MKTEEPFKKRGPSGIIEQVDPTQNNSEPVWDMVIRDMLSRKVAGLERYGTFLQAFNGRNPILDAYQESLDQAVYLRQMLEEWKVISRVVDAAVNFVNYSDEQNKERLVEAVREYFNIQ